MLNLNLGCGNKIKGSDIMQQWINVDIVAPEVNLKLVDPRTVEDIPNKQAHKYPYFLESDLRAIDLPDDYADHIFSSHVIEHIPVYDLDKTLKEWLRILKPGGSVAFEMPDVVKCAINILQLHTSRDLKMIDRLGLMGLYGEQFENRPYMIHRWGWTFQTLAPVLERCGFTRIREAAPVTHMGPSRDFRIEAIKPDTRYDTSVINPHD